MSYIINKFDGTPLVVLQDGSLDTSTSVGLLGRNYIGYGETQNENFVHLLENFAGTVPPPRPIDGQAWFNKTTKTLNVFTGETWLPLNSAIMSNIEPVATTGSFWFNTITNQLFLYDNDKWNLIGPEAAKGFGLTKFESTTILDSVGIIRPIIKVVVDNTTIAVFSKDSFAINLSNEIPGFFNIRAGMTLSANYLITGSLTGNATTATRFEVGKTINGVFFDGSSDITLRARTPNSLTTGNYLIGQNFDGSTEIEWTVDATPLNQPGKVIARDFNGNFSANIITANLSGNVLGGNVTVTTGTSTFNRVVANEFVGATLSGNAFSATRLQTARLINGVQFDGSTNITVGASGLDITGNRLASNVKETSITSLGTLTSLRVANLGIIIGSNNDISITASPQTGSILSSNNPKGLKIQILDTLQSNNSAEVDFISSTESVVAGGSENPSVVPKVDSMYNIGLPEKKFNNVYAESFIGVATHAENAELSTTQPPGTNNNTIATTAYVQSFIPTGVIVMWSGAISSIPTNWALCDGQNGTPDLRDRFIVGAGGVYALGDEGGSDSVSLLLDQLPSHSHTGATGLTSVDHTHSGTTSIESTSHSHAITISGAGQHYHIMPGDDQLAFANGRVGWSAVSDDGFSYDASSKLSGGGRLWRTSTNGSHSHTGTAGNNSQNHNHSFTTGNMSGASATHSHSFTTDATGNNSAIDIRPKYYALAYIMKL